MQNKRYIIGVVGATRNMDELPNGKAITLLSHEIGEEITSQQHILLTGGIPSNKIPSPVKSAAMQGAMQAGKNEHPARLISVLPKQPKFDIRYITDLTYKHLFINTTYSDRRNFINGHIPDVLIAVHGGAGTLSEIAFAHYFDVPVVFVQSNQIDTLNALKQSILIPSNKEKFQQIIEKTKKEFPLFEVTTLIKSISDLLNNSINKNAESAKDAVNKAIEIACNRPNTLPPNMSMQEEYEKGLNDLSI